MPPEPSGEQKEDSFQDAGTQQHPGGALKGLVLAANAFILAVNANLGGSEANVNAAESDFISALTKFEATSSLEASLNRDYFDELIRLGKLVVENPFDLAPRQGWDIATDLLPRHMAELKPKTPHSPASRPSNDGTAHKVRSMLKVSQELLSKISSISEEDFTKIWRQFLLLGLELQPLAQAASARFPVRFTKSCRHVQQASKAVFRSGKDPAHVEQLKTALESLLGLLQNFGQEIGVSADASFLRCASSNCSASRSLTPQLSRMKTLFSSGVLPTQKSGSRLNAETVALIRAKSRVASASELPLRQGLAIPSLSRELDGQLASVQSEDSEESSRPWYEVDAQTEIEDDVPPRVLSDTAILKRRVVLAMAKNRALNFEGYLQKKRSL